MVEKHQPPEKQDPHKNEPGEAQAAHQKMLGEANTRTPPLKQTEKSDSKSTTIEWPGGGKRTFERDDQGQLMRVVENDRTYYQKDLRNLSSARHMKGDTVISEGTLTVNDKTKEVTYVNHDNWTVTTLKADGSSIVRKHQVLIADDKGPVLEIHNPPKADGTAGDIRKFTYDEEGHITGYSVISANKNLCSNWKTNDGVHWRKVDEKGNYVKDADQEKDSKNILIGRMYVSPEGTFAFDNQRKGSDEAPHWTVVSADGHRHERITNLDKPLLANAKPSQQADAHEKEVLKGVDSVRELQANMVKSHFDEIKPNNPAGWVGLIGKSDVEEVLTDDNRSAEQKLAAAILKKYMDYHGIGMVHSNAINSNLFKETLSKMSLQDIAYDQKRKKTKNEK